MELVLTQHDEDVVCVLDELSELECDIARNCEVRSVPLNHGAHGVGTSYNSTVGEYSATVRAHSKEKARRAAEAYYESIKTELADTDG